MNHFISILFISLASCTIGYCQVSGVESTVDSIDLEIGDIGNPFDVNHIPIRKNQANVNSENLSLYDQLERHFSLIVVIGLLTLLAGVVLRQRDLLGAILRSLLRDYAITDLWRNESRGRSINLLAFYFFGISSMALFLTLAFELLQGFTYWKMYGLILCCLLGYFLLKHLILFFLKQVFSISSQVDYYSAQIVVTNILLGGGLFFLSIFMSFGPDIVHYPLKVFGFLIITLGLLLQIGRVVVHFLSDIIKHPFPYFVYLCALEISPILIFWSILSS